MNKLFLYAAAAALSIGGAACSNEEMVNPSLGGDGNVNFTVSLPGNAFSTRSFADGLTADYLQVAVYDAENGNLVTTKKDVTFGNSLQATVSLNLANGRSYKIAFFAGHEDPSGASMYKFDAENKTVTVDYAQMTDYNSADYDCFYVLHETGTITGPINHSVTLTRPVAQINWGTNDLYEETVSGDNGSYEKDAAKLVSTVTVKGVHNTLDLLTGETSASDSFDGNISFVEKERPAKYDETAGTGEKFPVNGHEYLSMQYVLVPTSASSVVDLELQAKHSDKKEVALSTVTVTNAPVQGNYRTNIYGALLTNPSNFTVIKDQNFAGDDNNIEIKPVAAGKVMLDDVIYNSIPEAIAAIKATSSSIYLGEGVYQSSDLVIPNGKTVENLSIVGQGKNTMIEKNAGQNVKAENLIFSNLTIKTNASNYNGFHHNGSETYDRCFIENALFLYGSTAKFENCTLSVDSDKLADSYNIWCYGAKEVSFESCNFNSAKSILVYCENNSMNQIVNVNNCVFNGTELKDGKAAIEVDCHRLGEGYKYTLNLNNNIAKGYDGGNLSGKQLWNVKDGEKFEVFENGKEVKQGLTTPDKNGSIFHVNTAEGLVQISNIVNNGYFKDGEKKSERYSGKTIVLTSDIDMYGVEFSPIGAGMDDNPNRNFAGTFDGNNKTISNLKASDNRSNYAAAGLFGGLIGVIKNVTLKNVDIFSTHYAGGIAGYVDNDTGSLIDNCKVIGGKITSTAEIVNGKWDNGDKVGGILGYGCIGADKVTNCYVEGLTLTAYRDCGAVVGFANKAENVTGNSAKNVTMIWDSTYNYKEYESATYFGNVVGRVGSGNLDESNTFEGIVLRNWVE